MHAGRRRPGRGDLGVLAEHDIAVVVHGDDIADEVIEALYGDAVPAGKLRLVRRETGVSTTGIIQRVQGGG